MIKKYFFTGLVILLPFIVTVVLVVFGFNLLSKPLQGMMAALLNHYGLDGKLSLWGFKILPLISKLLSFLILMTFVLVIGSVGRTFFMRGLIRFGDYFIHRIPVVNKIYKASQEVVRTLFVSSSHNFSQVVLVPFPHPKSRSIGFLTNENKALDPESQGLVSVFVPGTPNPTIGFMIMFKREQLIFTEMSVEETLKFIVSCGVASKATEISSVKQTNYPELNPSTISEV